jgi:hypothetical protein
MREQVRVPLYLTVPSEDDAARDAWMREQAHAAEERERVEQGRVCIIHMYDTEDTGEQGVIVFDSEGT